MSSDPSAKAYGRRAEALAKEDMLPAFVAYRLLRRSRLGEVSTKAQKRLRLAGCEAVRLHKRHLDV
ncbi:MAG: hypothetical protein OEY86_14715 [Nitrospira sp.]|nr:hypothetical protein [Nitrospira sp.]